MGKKSSTTSKRLPFLNFTASHDGIGVRPLEGILPQKEILSLANEIGEKGGLVSMRKMEDGSESPYELNTTYLSALADPKMRASDEPDFYAQAVALSMKGTGNIFPFTLRYGKLPRWC